MKDFDVVVIGAGPAGYAGAIRCAQYGLKTAIIEKEYFGGTCLNVGCIPSKALIHATKTLDHIRHSDVMGISSGTPKVDVKKMMSWKSGVVEKLTTGVKSLLKANKVEVINGLGRFVDKHTLEVNGEKIKFKNAIIATGSVVSELPFAKTDGKTILNSTHALSLQELSLIHI